MNYCAGARQELPLEKLKGGVRKDPLQAEVASPQGLALPMGPGSARVNVGRCAADGQELALEEVKQSTQIDPLLAAAPTQERHCRGAEAAWGHRGAAGEAAVELGRPQHGPSKPAVAEADGFQPHGFQPQLVKLRI